MPSHVFGGNLVPKLSIYSNQLRLLPLQWMRKNVVRCLSQKSNGSGLPVRYISKKHREANQTSDINSVDIPLIDGVPSISEGTKSFEVISDKGKLWSAERKVANSLSNSRYGLINDGLYAETFSHSRWKSSSWGPRRIKQALTVKGVSENEVKKAVKLVFEDSEEGDQSSSIKLSSSSLHQLYIQASKQWKRSQNAPHETRKSRLIRWLQYRGFDWGVVGTIMKKIEAENPR